MTVFSKVGPLIAAAVLLSGNVNAKDRDKVLFLDASAGYSLIPYNKLGDWTQSSELDDNALVYGGALGFRLTDNYFFTLNYQKNALNSVEVDHMYATANFRFRFKRSSFAPYAGLIGGISVLHWKTPPVETDNPVEDSTSALWGVQFGDEYLLSDHWQLYGAYQFTRAVHETKIVGEGSVEYKDTHVLVVGIRFGFIDP
jgi:hypothetical protein